ncbi:dodecin [Legionella fallonii]|uniref:Protein with a Dodecin-like topology n=1 Tax=Legionella fallonii LLAP-10 TaxID=1212491 RepID=A0A098G306_9GAMM|nr:dodecin [Legionella fallonii]CEG56371.1 protein with a Dodecin-like topology [Legionella fallonii LLAP-10]
MTDKVYELVELVGTSQDSIEQAISNAINQAAKLHGKLDWFEVLETRGFIDDNKVKYYQVHLKIGYSK